MKLTNEELRQRVSLAGQDRFCPTASMLMEKEQGPEFQEHLKHCALCRARLEDAEALSGELALEKLAEMLDEDIVSRPAPVQVRPGQVWQLAPAHGGWGAYAQYYHVPQVLVLDVLPYGVVRVAHVSTFGVLGRKDDIFLTDDPSEGFAELWNTYSLPQSWLDVHVGSVKSGIIAAGKLLGHLGMGKEPEEGSPIDIFRQQERFHSMHFAMKAVEEVMELTEKWGNEQSRQNFSQFLGLAGWEPVRIPEKDDGLYAAAAASASLRQCFGEGDSRNCCHVKYEEGHLSYKFNYIPAHTVYGVALLHEGKPIPVLNQNGDEELFVLVNSDAKKKWRCSLDEQAFRCCVINIFQKNTSDC